MSDTNRYATLISSTIGHKMHRYNEVDSAGHVPTRGDAKRNINNLHRPKPSKCSVPCTQVMGTTRNQAWPHPSPLHAVEQQADLFLMCMAKQLDMWEAAESSWVTIHTAKQPVVAMPQVSWGYLFFVTGGNGWHFCLGLAS